MSDFAITNYNNLLKLVKENEAFYFKDFFLDDKVYRIFNYRLASWTSFKEPGALNCRGIMFDVTDPENVKLSSLPPEKFFNYEEGGVDHKSGTFGDKMVKMDGSLISTFIHNGDLYLKSKGSIASIQSDDVMKLINLQKNQAFKNEMKLLAQDGYTISLEYTSPNNRIVVSYPVEKLTVLAVRSHETGENYFATKLKSLLMSKGDFPEILKNLVAYEDLRGRKIEHDSFVEEIRNEINGEGYVTEIILSKDYSYLVKNKNLKYVTLHHTKESISNPRRLFEVVINEATDDLRSLFSHDDYVLNQITEMENYVQPIYNNIIKTVENFVNDNRHLERKEYATKAIADEPYLSKLIIQTYLGEKLKSGEIVSNNKRNKEFEFRDIDYKEFSIRKRTIFYPNVADITIALEEEDESIENNDLKNHNKSI